MSEISDIAWPITTCGAGGLPPGSGAVARKLSCQPFDVSFTHSKHTSATEVGQHTSAAGDNRPMGTIERPLPPLNADERTTLESWLHFHRTTLAMKCEGLDDEQAAVASVPPSGFTLTGLVQHMAEVERNWFRRVLAGEHAPPIYDPQADPDGPDGGFDLAQGAALRDALATWRAEIARAREQCAGRALADTGRFMEQDVNLDDSGVGRGWLLIAVCPFSAMMSDS